MARLLDLCLKELRVCLTTVNIPLGTSRHITTSSAAYVGSKHRFSKGEAANNSSYGPLVDLPDYTYLDGQPSELSQRQGLRRTKRIELASKVSTYIAEMMEAKKVHQIKQEQKTQEREELIRSQLKPKVHE
ncbi:Hypothetical predicted protein [Octopus vulgaris]|uniref:Large ribosomal subunit protein mL52 n=1 Tax=Octopus vulgaris TaxID=6645 RepID=A0AA36FM13_OCTVU|nr:Hypothetical predicted protein [Octopus vulgaris]